MMTTLKNTLDNPEKTVYPTRENIFKAFRVCPEEKLKVVFVGQDPYLNNKATGLCFANPPDLLRKDWTDNLKTIQDAVERVYPGNGAFMDPTLESWAEQGVLCLNSALTTVPKERSKHIAFWKPFISTIINTVSKRKGIVFVLFGTIAKQMRPYIEEGNLIIELDHPSICSIESRSLPLDFITINEYLFEKYGEGISWVQLPF